MNAKYMMYIPIIILAAVCLFPGALSAQESGERHEGWFYADEHPEVVEALGDHEFAQGVLDALADAGSNWTELWAAIDSTEGILWSHTCWLVINMPHLDRLEMTTDLLQEHVRFAYATRTQLPYTCPQELFREYILTYRIGDEPVRPWRSNIWWTYQNLIGDSAAETARAINQWVNENMIIRDRGFFGPRPDPWSVIRARTGTEEDIACVAIAMCKTFGVPARRARIEVLGEESGGRTWLEIFSDGEWLPMYPFNPEEFGNAGFIERDHPHNVTVVSVNAAFTSAQVTSRYSDTGTLRLVFTRDGEPVDDFEHFSISSWNGGAWLPLDDLGFDLEEEKMVADEEGFVAVLGDGFYVVQAGVRNPQGDAWVKMVPVELNPGDEIDLTIELNIPASELQAVDLVQRRIDPLPELNLEYASEGFVFNFPADISSEAYTCLVIFDPDAEPSIRMLPLICEWGRDSEVPVIGISAGESDASLTVWCQSLGDMGEGNRFFTDPEGTIATAFGSGPNEEGAYPTLPFVMLLNPAHEIIYLHDGLSLSVADDLARALELDSE